MAHKISLPPCYVVQKWDQEKVLKWLKKVKLEDCIPAFEHRKIDGTKLLELTEQKLFAFQDMKIKHRGQIAKCVNECKSQASNAKRIVGTIRQHKPRDKATVAPVSNGEYYESDDDFDYWDSDFDEDFDDEEFDETPNGEVTSAVQTVEDSITVQAAVSPESSPESNSISTAKVIPKPPDVPIVSPTFTSTSQKQPHRNSIPRPPLKRPPSQPPPPPVVTQASSPPTTPILEDYEVPINHQGSTAVSPTPQTTFELGSSCSSSQSEISAPETYEVIETHEENYEIIESPPIPIKTPEKPLLPPRLLASTSRPCVPPPLPQKPKKFKDTQNSDACRPQSRPKLPLKQEDDGNDGTIVTGIGSVIINSFLGRKNSSPSAKPPHIKDPSCSDDSISNNQQSNPQVNGQICSLSAEKVSSPAFVSGTKSVTADAVKMFPYVSQDGAESAGHLSMATRPLPPVPQTQTSQVHSDSLVQQDISFLPWFHEIERHEAEQEIQKLAQNGAFLVRPSKRAGKENPYTLTCLHDGKVFHLNIRQRPDGCFALGKEKRKEKTFPNVVALISFHQTDPILLTSRGESAGQTTLRMFPQK